MPSQDSWERNHTPILATRAWQARIEGAGKRCQCVGACGRKHNPAGKRPVQQLRCPVTLAAERLYAAPHPATQAGLLAWCSECLASAVNAARREATPPPQAEALFDVTPAPTPGERR